MPSTKKNIWRDPILVAIAGILVTIAIAVYTFSPNLVPTELNPPPEINYNLDKPFSFSLHNYGEKAGSYYVQMSSDTLLVKVKNSEYKNQVGIAKHIEDGSDSTHIFYLKANESNLPMNITFKLTYLDKSPLIFNKKYVWNYYYKLDDSLGYGQYAFGNVQSKENDCIPLNDKYSYCIISNS